MDRTARLGTILLAAVAACGCEGATLTPELASARAAARASAGRELDPATCAFGRDFTLASSNDFYPLGVGSRWSLEGEEDGALVELRITVLDETEDVGGVTTRVIEEVEWEDGELIEVSRNFVAATEDGAVCYFGEEVDIYEDGEVVSHEGAWRADAAGNFPGVLMPADPRPGQRFLMEGAPGTAEDEGLVVGTGPVRVPAGSFSETVRIRESSPLDGDFDFKVYAKGVGLLVDGPLSLVGWEVTAQGG